MSGRRKEQVKEYNLLVQDMPVPGRHIATLIREQQQIADVLSTQRNTIYIE